MAPRSPNRAKRELGRIFMKMKLALLSLGALCLVAGCAEDVHTRVALRGPGERIVIRTAPPPPRQEVIVEAPGPHEKWVWDPGHYRWEGGQYVWIAGHWIERPRPQAEWIAGHWDQRHGEWIWVDGHWR